jgi:hypothetical protein
VTDSRLKSRCSVPIRKLDHIRLSDSILCQSRPFDSQTIRNPEKKCPVTSLDRFIKKSVIKNILFVAKRSRLVRKNIRSGFQMVSVILFLPFESRINRSSPDHLKAGLTSLDRFINKTNLLFMPKRSRLATIRKPDKRLSPDHSIAELF